MGDLVAPITKQNFMASWEALEGVKTIDETFHLTTVNTLAEAIKKVGVILRKTVTLDEVLSTNSFSIPIPPGFGASRNGSVREKRPRWRRQNTAFHNVSWSVPRRI